MAEDVRAGAGSEVITEEQLRKAEEYVQQEEGAANRLSGWVGIVVTGIAVAMTLFHLYAAYDIVPTIPLRYTHVAFVLLLSFLLFPLSERFRNRIQWFDVIPPLLGIATIVYALAQGDDFTDRAAVPEKWDVILGAIFIVLVLEAARRTTGWVMAVAEIKHAVERPEQLVELVRAEQHGDLPLAANPAHHIDRNFLAVGVEADQRLVEEQKPWRPDQRLCEQQALPLAPGHFGEWAVGKFMCAVCANTFSPGIVSSVRAAIASTCERHDSSS